MSAPRSGPNWLRLSLVSQCGLGIRSTFTLTLLKAPRTCTAFRIADHSLEKVASLGGIRLAPTLGGNLTGLAPDDSPLVVRNVGNQEIYALDLELP